MSAAKWYCLSVLTACLLSGTALAECRVPAFDAFQHPDWAVDQPVRYDDSKYGFSIAFHGRHAKGTFFIYDYGVSNPEAADAEEQLKQAVHEVYYIAEKLTPETVLSDPYLVPEKLYADIGFVDNAVYLTTSSNTGQAVTVASMGLLHGCFHKLRYTHPVQSLETVDISEGLKGFIVLIQEMNDTMTHTNYLK
ncbi:hypothetical protein [Roseibium sp. MMSF_3544]|uniref:hypothetical protein n=1 Tax=unclassified Roseibium TaxID=2629323 RepID=UPI00273DE84E|nr:hypothetical protein [Roseibium sp. MMSF_3544]